MTSAGQNLPQPGHFKVRTFLEVPADTPSEAVGAFIDKVNKLGLWNFFFFVEDESGQIWVVNLSEPEPLCMRLEDWHTSQTQMGLGAPVDPDDEDEGDEVDQVDDAPPEPTKPSVRKTAAPTTQPAQRPTRTQAASAPTAPAESRAIPTDPRQAIKARTRQRRQGS